MPNKAVLYTAVALALVVAGLSGYAKFQADRAADAHELALRAVGAAEAQQAINRAIDAERNSLRARVAELAERVREAESHRVKPPPPAPLAPVTDEELQHGLIDLGMSATTRVHLGVQTILDHPDATLVFRWGQEFLRIPTFEAKSKADDAIISAQKDLEGGLRGELAGADKQLQGLTNLASTLQIESDARKRENEALVHLRLAETRRLKIGVAIALPVAGYIGYRLGKH